MLGFLKILFHGMFLHAVCMDTEVDAFWLDSVVCRHHVCVE